MNVDLHETFPHSSAQNLCLWGSGHLPVVASILRKQIKARKKTKFDKRWLASEENRHVIFEGWNYPEYHLMRK